MSSGFVYYLSVAGITGERNRLPSELAGGVRNMKSLTDKPVCVGFGISTAEQVKELAAVADGAIVGSAVVRRMKENADAGTDAIVDVVSTYCRQLLSQVR